MNYKSFDNEHRKNLLPMEYKSSDQENEIKDLFDQMIILSKILDNHDSLEFLKRKENYFLSLEIDVYEKNKIKKKIKKYYQTSNYILKLFSLKFCIKLVIPLKLKIHILILLRKKNSKI